MIRKLLIFIVLAVFLSGAALAQSYGLSIIDSTYESTPADESMSTGVPPFPATLENITDSLSDYTAGHDAIHQVGFQLPQHYQFPFGLLNGRQVAVTFPPEFDLRSITSVEYRDTDDSSTDPRIAWVFIYHETVVVRFRKNIPGPSDPSFAYLTFSTIKNPTEARDFRVLVQVDNYFAQTVAGPNHSDYFSIVPDSPAQMTVSPGEALFLPVGETASFEATVSDQYDNHIDAYPIVWQLDQALDNIGQVTGSTLLATTVGTGRMMAEFENLSAFSGPIRVIAGAADAVLMTSEPDTVNPGEALHNDITIEIIDSFGNRKTDYAGSLWFVSDDPQAEIVHDESNPYHFTAQDQGRRLFSGNEFVFQTPGQRILSVLTDDGLSASRDDIFVIAGGLGGFSYSYPDSIRAGWPFVFSIIDAVDISGQPYSGTLSVSGGHTAPDGTEPILNDIVVVDGQGSAEFTLFAADENTFLQIGADGIEQEVVIDVLPAGLSKLHIECSNTQFVGHPFIGGLSIAAFDDYGNIKVDLNEQNEDLMLSVDSGSILPETINTTEFKDGVATIDGVVYNGAPGLRELMVSLTSPNEYPITAQTGFSANGITMVLSNRYQVPEKLPQGWTCRIRGDFHNNGNIAPVQLTAAGGFVTDQPLEPMIVSPSDCLPEPGEQVSCYFQQEPLTDIAPGSYQFALQSLAHYDYAGETIPVVITIEYPSEILPFAPFSLSDIEFPSRVIQAEQILDGKFVLQNGNDYDDESHLSMTVSAVSPVMSRSIGQVLHPEYTWPPNLHLTLPLMYFEDLALGEYTYQVRLHLDYSTNYSTGMTYYDTTFELPQTLTVIPKATYSVDGSQVMPASAAIGTMVPFTIPLDIIGQSNIHLDGETTTFTITDGQISSSARLAEDDYSFAPGLHPVISAPLVIPENWEGKQLTGILHLMGTEEELFDVDETLTFAIPLSIIPRSKILIVDLAIDAPNDPFVTTGQIFGLHGKIWNSSTSDFEGPLSIAARTNGQSVISSPAVIDMIPAGDTVDVSYIITAAQNANPAERFYLQAISQLDEPLGEMNNDAIAVIQTPPYLSLSAHIQGRTGDVPVLDFNEVITISANYRNDGQARISGGTLLLNFDGPQDFGIDFPMELPLDEQVNWAVITPSEEFISHFTVSWGQAPIDINTEQPVTGLGESVEIPFSVEASVTKLVIQADSFDTRPLERNVKTKLLELMVENLTTDTRNIIGLKTIMIAITDRDGNTIDGDYIVDTGGSYFSLDGEIKTELHFVNGKLAYKFNDMKILAGQTVVLELYLTPKTGALLDFFNMRLENDDISAVFVSGPRTGQAVPVTGVLDRAFEINIPQAIIATEFGESFKNYPNPFNPNSETTEFIYNLPADSDVDIYIYTATGERVRHLHYAAGSEGGQADQLSHAYWDGRNGEGDVVMNGVYIAFIEVAQGNLTAKLKMAVVK